MSVYRIEIPDWHPAPVNALYASHWAQRARLKKNDKAVVALYALQANVPKATGKRRVRLVLTLRPRQRGMDPDAPWKTVLDALTACGLLLDDNRQGCELLPVEYVRGARRATTVELTDLP